jgi:hypothetical protein
MDQGLMLASVYVLVAAITAAILRTEDEFSDVRQWALCSLGMAWPVLVFIRILALVLKNGSR